MPGVHVGVVLGVLVNVGVEGEVYQRVVQAHQSHPAPRLECFKQPDGLGDLVHVDAEGAVDLGEHLDPGGLDALEVASPGLDGHFQHLLDEGLGATGHRLPLVLLEVHLRFHHFFQDFLLVFAAEGRLSTQQDEQYDTTGPDIALLDSVFLVNYFRSYVVGSHDAVEVLHLAVQAYCRAEVYYLYLQGVLLHKQYVFQLHVSVHYLLLVAVEEGLEELLHDVGGFTLAESDDGLEAVEEAASLEVLHDDVQMLFILEVLVHLDYVGVVELAEDVDFVEDGADDFLRALLDDLHGADLVSGQVHDHEHLPAASLAYLLYGLVILQVVLALANEEVPVGDEGGLGVLHYLVGFAGEGILVLAHARDFTHCPHPLVSLHVRRSYGFHIIIVFVGVETQAEGVIAVLFVGLANALADGVGRVKHTATGKLVEQSVLAPAFLWTHWLLLCHLIMPYGLFPALFLVK